MSETNGAAERSIQSLSKCARALLGQSGLGHFFWPYAAYAAAFSLDIRPGAEGKSARERGRGGRWMGPALPFGRRMSFMPSLTGKRKKG
eukprot:4881653-Alexandrium_andersonii.AAC.1